MKKFILNNFHKENLINIFEILKTRNNSNLRIVDRSILKKIKSITGVPVDVRVTALFEYLLAISFYWISNQKMKVSDLFKLSLDSNLMPKSHTPGLRADLILR